MNPILPVKGSGKTKCSVVQKRQVSPFITTSFAENHERLVTGNELDNL
jgi:hypothetical protein